MSRILTSSTARSTLRVLLGSIVVFGLLAPIVPTGLPWLPSATAQEAEPGVWRVRSLSWFDNWAEGNQILSDVEFVDEPFGFAVLVDEGDHRDALLQYNSDVDTWTVVNDAREDGQEFLAGVEFYDKDLGLSYGRDHAREVNHGVWKTTNSGRTWFRVLERESSLPINDFAFTTGDGSDVVGVGRNGAVIRSTDGGETWPHDDTEAGGAHLNAVEFVPDDSPGRAIGVAVGAGGTLLTSDDGGMNWTPVTGVSLSVDEENGVEVGSISDVDLLDVALVETGDGNGDGPIVGVAVGTNGAVLYNEDVRSDPSGWHLATLNSARGLVLQGVALAENGDAGLVGYVVSGAEEIQGATPPVVLEMQDGDPAIWAPAPIDPRAAAFHGISGADSPYQLRAVAVDPGDESAVAVGGRLMLERTPVLDANTFAEDRWWQCLPEDPERFTGNPPIDDPLAEIYRSVWDEGLGDNVPAEQICDARREALGSTDESSFGSHPAIPCEFDTAEQAETFPCRTTWKPVINVDAEGNPQHQEESLDTVFLDEDVAREGRRVVAVSHGRKRVFLFDPDMPTGQVDSDGQPLRGVQRGVRGFGEGMKRGAQRDDPAEFDGRSLHGFETGFVRLSEAPGAFPRGATLGTSAYDDEQHTLYFGSTGEGFGENPVIGAMSVTGEFEPTAVSVPALPSIEGAIENTEGASNRTNAALTHLAADSEYGMLYALTQTNYRLQLNPQITWTDATQVTLHAYATEVDSQEGTLEMTRAWSLPLEDHGCRSTVKLNFLGASPDGESLAFACNGHAGPHFGMPNLESHKIVTVRLQLRGTDHPSDLDATRGAGQVVVHTEPIAGKVLGESNVALGVESRSVLAWNQTAEGAGLWDFEIGGWVGLVPRTGIHGVAGFGMGAEHPWRGRLYVSRSGGATVVDSLNVPAQVPAQPVRDVWATGKAASVISPYRPGEQPRVVFKDTGGVVHVFEDRVSPTGRAAQADPDDANNPDVPEAQAASVKRIGRASGFGARVWWTGAGSATAAGCQLLLGDGPLATINDSCGEPTLSYDWLTGKESETAAGQVPFGRHTSAMPGKPGGGTRELRFGAVQEAVLENNLSGKLSSANATGLFYDGGPADDEQGATGEDLHRRRGRDLHDFTDAEITQFCETVAAIPGFGDAEEPCADNHDDFQEQAHGPFDEGFEDFEVQFDEMVDRGMREVDGERKIPEGCEQDPDPDAEGEEGEVKDNPDTEGVNEADCRPEFDRHDPRCDRDDDGNVDCRERESVSERVGMTYPSTCLEPAGTGASWAGSRTKCVVGDFGRTEAGAEVDRLSLTPEQASAASSALEGLSVGATGSETEIFRDSSSADRGIVVETTAWATDVKLQVGAQASLSIGEVRQVARARAHGQEHTAVSSREVSFADVVVTGPGGEQRFACGRSEPDADPLRPPEDRDRDGDGRPDECDPHELADVISTVFAGKVQATTSAADQDPEVRHSDGGTQAIIRRDPVDVLSDSVINRFEMWEVPALELTVFNDQLRSNRVKVDLAAVYADTSYVIGQLRTEFPPQPGTVEVELSDVAGAPLPGGSFALTADGTVIDECRTDARGSCSWSDLEAGSYTVEQRFAPPGYLPEEAPRPVFVAEGASETVGFVNLPDSAGVVVELVDPSGNPLEGGAFALVPDPDSDGALAPTDAAAASCVTDGAGLCRFERVGLGGWILHQSAAPAGYQTADDIAFALQQPGQVAQVRVVNGLDAASAGVTIIEIIDDVEPTSSSPDDGWWALPKGLAALLQRGWVQALLFGLTGMLFGAPAYLAHRRRELALAKRR